MYGGNGSGSDIVGILDVSFSETTFWVADR